VCTAAERYGTMPLQSLVAPAIDLADKGFVPDGELALTIGGNLADLNRYPATAAIFTRNGLPLRPGSPSLPSDRLVQTDLAQTLRRVAREGPGVFYGGELGAAGALHIQENGGVLSQEDLRSFNPHVGAPERLHTYRGYEYASSPYIALVLNILEQLDLASVGADDARFCHLMIEAQRQAFCDCIFHLADPEEAVSPVHGLLSKEYAAEIVDRIDRGRAAESVVPGDPWPYERRITGMREPTNDATRRKAPPTADTTQIVSMDKDGNVTAMNTTLGGAFGSKVTIPGTGIVMNDGMVSFDPEPGHANSIRGGRSIVSFSPPTLLMREGRPFLAVSASGGRRTVSAIAHIVCNITDFQMGIQDAIAAPRVHCELGRPFVDSRLPKTARDTLEAMGHEVVGCAESFYASYFGRPVGILRDPATGRLTGGAAPLRRAAAVGF
jgi:gamma-glutamyltranspeptidase/glutathione hydrolase